MAKNSLKIDYRRLGVLLIALCGLFFLGSKIFGAVFFVEDFEIYADESLIKDQGGWTCPTSPFIHSYIVNDDESSSGSQSIRAGTTANVRRCEKDFGEVEEATISIDFYFTDINDFTLFQLQDDTFARIQFSLDNNQIWYLNPSPDELIYDNVASSTWHTLTIDWRSGDQARVKLDARAWSSWLDPDTEGIDTIHFSSWNTTGEIYIDYIRIDEILEPLNAYVIPELPIDCQINIVDYDDISLKGVVKVPFDNPNTYDKLIVDFQKIGSEILSQFNYIDLPDLIGGEDYNYNATTTITIGEGSFRVLYRIKGYTELGKVVEDFQWCEGTFITESVPIPPEIIEEIGGFATPDLEDCSAITPITAKYLCELKNLIISAIVPSQEKIGELKQNVELLSQKFPMNYLLSSFNFFGNLRQESTSHSTIDFQILGQAGSVNFDFWDKSTTFAGATQKLSEILKTFTTFIVLIVFVMWGITYGRRVFK